MVSKLIITLILTATLTNGVSWFLSKSILKNIIRGITIIQVLIVYGLLIFEIWN